MMLAILYCNSSLPKAIDNIRSNAFDTRQLEDLARYTIIYHLFSIFVAGSDWYPFWLWRFTYKATHFQSWIGIFIALRCYFGGHPWILIILAGFFTKILVGPADRFYDYLDGYWRYFREDNELVTDAFSPGTSSYRALDHSVKSNCKEDSELVADAPPTGADVHSALRESAKSAARENNDLVPDALLPGSDAYRALVDSVKSACLKDTEWIIDIYKTRLESVKLIYQKALEEMREDSIVYVKGGSRSPIYPFDQYQQRQFLHC